MRLAHAAGDQLRVLGSVVDDQDEIRLHGGSLIGEVPSPRQVTRGQG